MADLWGKLHEGEVLCESEKLMFASEFVKPNKITFERICIGKEVELLEFANGAVFTRVKE